MKICIQSGTPLGTSDIYKPYYDSLIRHAKRVAFSGQGLFRQLVNLMRNALAVTHAVQRRDALLRPYDTLVSYKHLKPLAFTDWLATYVAVASGGVRFIARPMTMRDETRMLDQPGTFPAELEIEVPYTDLGRRLRELGDPLSPMIAQALGRTDVKTFESVTQRLLIKEYTPSQMNYEPPWLAARIPVALDPIYQQEVDEVLAIVARHRSLPDTLLGMYLNFPGVDALINFQRRVAWKFTRVWQKLRLA